MLQLKIILTATLINWLCWIVSRYKIVDIDADRSWPAWVVLGIGCVSVVVWFGAFLWLVWSI
jgi:hypothetical protein